MHERDTRANVIKRELFERQVALKRKRIQTETKRKQKGRVEIEQENFDKREEDLIAFIERLRPKAKVLLREEDEYLRKMNDDDLCILQNAAKEVSDNVLFIALRYLIFKSQYNA